MGLTEQEAEGRGAAYVTATDNYSDTAYGASIEYKDGFVKVLADPEPARYWATTSLAPTPQLWFKRPPTPCGLG